MESFSIVIPILINCNIFRKLTQNSSENFEQVAYILNFPSTVFCAEFPQGKKAGISKNVPSFLYVRMMRVRMDPAVFMYFCERFAL